MTLSVEQLRRYARQIKLPEVGDAGQSQLARSSVLLIGTGGLGSAAALYLAAAGVGRLGLDGLLTNRLLVYQARRLQ